MVATVVKRAPKGAAKKSPARPRARIEPRVQQRLLAWFDEHGRSFAWRDTRDPYPTMVAEVMLQQTQTGRVAPAYEEFLRRFPTIERLAHAPAMEVIQAWHGLGYNRRAVDLHRAAQSVVGEFGGVFPQDPATLRKLPGFGEYTAAALACFAFDAQVPVVDTNVSRVLSRALAGTEPSDLSAAKVRAFAASSLPDGKAYPWNQALMDVGATLCRPERPLCAQCPFERVCAYRVAGRHRRSPAAVRSPRKGEPFEGSRRQVRGGIVDELRRSARKGITLGSLAGRLHPGARERNLDWLVEILCQLEREGLARLTDGARRGLPRGLVRLPH